MKNTPKPTQPVQSQVQPSQQQLANKKSSKYYDEKKQRQENLKFYCGCDSRDIQYTLNLHSKEDEENANISRFYEEREKEMNAEEAKKSRDQSKKRRQEEAMKRLCPDQGFQKEIPKQAEESQNRQIFVRKIITLYKFDRPDANNFRKPDLLFNFWNKLENKEAEKLAGDSEEVKDNIDTYFQERLEILGEMFQKKNGYQSDKADDIVKFWKTINKNDKIKYQLDFESAQNVQELLEEYLQQKKDQENVSMFIQEQQMKEKQQKDKERLEKVVLKKKIEKTPLEQMAKAKDRMKVGKTLLEMKKMYPDDKVLRRMLLQEFKDTKVAKLPLSYDIVDSDEENLTKVRHTSQKEGVARTLEDIDAPSKMREEELAELFEQHLNDYYSTKSQVLRQGKEQKQKESKEDRMLRRVIENSAEKYLQLRKKRFEEKILSLNEYLSALYKECLSRYQKATKRNFPHSIYGESKRLKKKSFPPSLKRYFFASMRSYVRKKYAYAKDKDNRLAFWVPPSDKGGMCRVHKFGSCPPGCIQQTSNKRVFEQSRLEKERQILSDRPETSVWDNNGYFQEKMQIMMTFSDAKECTFQPAVCARMPNKLKKQIKELHNWAGTYVDKKGSFQNFLKKFGDNFIRIPRVYRFGIYKKSVMTAKKGDYLAAYKMLAKVFNIKEIKKEFNHPDFRSKKRPEHPLFNDQKIELDEEAESKLPSENFNDDANRNFLLEVYGFILKLESYEQDLVKTQGHINKLMSKYDQPQRFAETNPNASSYQSRRNLIKDEMCPLGSKCPSQIQRWPQSNIPSVTPVGAECMFAHHQFELKFARELRSKNKALKQVMKQVTQHLEGTKRINAWNPGGNLFQVCKGCGKCNTCLTYRTNVAKLQNYKKQSIKKKRMIQSQVSFKQKNRQREHEAKALNHKMGCLAKASALCSKERFSEAFKVIAQAVELVKQEIEETQKKKSDYEHKLKSKLHFDPEMEITVEQVFLAQTNPNPDDLQEAQKLHYFANKTNLSGDQPPDVNEFVNLQIERMYLKIENALKSQIKDIDLMKTKIEKLEEEDDMFAKTGKSSRKMKMCEAILKDGKCSLEGKCTFGHTAIELDMVKNEKKIESLQKSISSKNQNLVDSKPPVSWVPSSKKDSGNYQNTKKVDRDGDVRRLQQSPKHGLKGARSFRDHSLKTIYDRDIDDLKAPVNERTKKSKY